jgi:cold-inducible RNA-binding protein
LDCPHVFARVNRHPAGATSERALPREKETAIPRKVFVGNLSFDVTREELIEAFSEAGAVVDAKVPTDRETGRPRGFAFVEFQDEGAARRCIEQMKGRSLRINEAEDRPPRPPGAGPSRGPAHGFSRPSPSYKPPPEPDFLPFEKEERGRGKRFRQKPARRSHSRRRRDQIVDDEDDY